MKYIFLAAAFVFLSGISVAHAHAPVIAVDPVSSLEHATFPQAYDVTGTISHSPLSSIKNLTLWVNGTTSTVIADPFASSTATTSPFSMPWSIEGPGTYTLFVTARHGTTGQTGTSSEQSIVVTQAEVPLPPPPAEEGEEEESPVVDVKCPAAPSIAGAYMRSHTPSIKEGSVGWKNVMNIITKQTGSTGSLWAAHGCHEGYADEVKSIINEFLNW